MQVSGCLGKDLGPPWFVRWKPKYSTFYGFLR